MDPCMPFDPLAPADPFFAFDPSPVMDPLHQFTTGEPLSHLSPGPSGDCMSCLAEIEPLGARMPLCPLNGTLRPAVPQTTPKTPPSPVMLYCNGRKALREMSPLLGSDLRHDLFERQSFDTPGELGCEQSPRGPMVRICRSCRVLGSRIHAQDPEDPCLHNIKFEEP